MCGLPTSPQFITGLGWWFFRVWEVQASSAHPLCSVPVTTLNCLLLCGAQILVTPTVGLALDLSLTWELVRNVCSWAPCKVYWIRLCILTLLPGGAWDPYGSDGLWVGSVVSVSLACGDCREFPICQPDGRTGQGRCIHLCHTALIKVWSKADTELINESVNYEKLFIFDFVIRSFFLSFLKNFGV